MSRIFAREAALKVASEGVRLLRGTPGLVPGVPGAIAASLRMDRIEQAHEGLIDDMDFVRTALYARPVRRSRAGPAAAPPRWAFDNNLTIYGPEGKALAGRYLLQMVDELRALLAPDGAAGSLLDSVDLIVPHQANKTMVTQLATKAGLDLDRVYLKIAKVGNASAANIPLAIHDAVRDGVIKEPSRIFAPGYGAGAVAGYAVLRVDPAVVATTDRAASQRS